MILVSQLTLLALSTSPVVRLDLSAKDLDDPRWQSHVSHQVMVDHSTLNGLAWRSIGPTIQGGRVVDVESIPGEPYGFYLAYATGGVWKTTNNGVTFTPLSDRLATMVTGDIAVDPNNPKRLWIGSGEPNAARSNYGGMGVFVSDDGGATFRHVGLTDVDRIARVIVHPKDGKRVCVAASGKLYTEGGRRGVLCSHDDGETWAHVLKTDGFTGAIDLAFDPNDPDTLYAATWERSRKPWAFEESGAGSAIWKSTDGGMNWTKSVNGFPQGAHVGRIGLAVSNEPGVLYASVDNFEDLPANEQDLGDRPLSPRRLKSMSKEDFLRQDPDEIEAFIRSNDFDVTLDAKSLIDKVRKDEVNVADLVAALNDAEAALFNTDIRGLEIYRSNDGGASWARTHDHPLTEVTYTYGYYFGQIRVSPADVNRIYVTGVPMITSADGGRTFTGMNDPDVHVDHHAWWIDPAFPDRIINGNDGGADISYDGGKTWLKLDAQPVGQFYTINVDMAEPYNVYGGLQDNGTVKGSSTSRWELGEDFAFIGGGDGMHVQIDPRDGTVFTGYQFGYYRRDGKNAGEVRPREAFGDKALRYNWNTPVVLSPHNPDVVYFGANKLFRSFDQGKTWAAISDDLTTSRNRGNVPFATLTSVSESPKQFGLLWAGTDDGQVWVTTGGGTDWRNVSGDLPGKWVSRVIASSHVRDRAYLTMNAYREDSITPYVWVTEDLGKRWTSIVANLPNETVNVVREDPVNADVLYVGTDRSVYVSLDRGTSWQVLNNGLPNVPVHDLVIHPRDRELVAGTHGRSAFVIDVLPVQELTADVRARPLHVFHVDDIQASRDWRSRASLWFDESAYLPKVKVSYWSDAAGDVTLAVKDTNGQIVRNVTATAKVGLNTLEWNAEVDADLAQKAESVALKKSDKSSKNQDGALAKRPYSESIRLKHRLLALPGDYTLHLTRGKASADGKLTIKAPEPFKPRGVPKPKLRGRDD